MWLQELSCFFFQLNIFYKDPPRYIIELGFIPFIAIMMKMAIILLMSFFVHLPGPCLIFNYRSRIVCTLLLPKSRNFFFCRNPSHYFHILLFCTWTSNKPEGHIVKYGVGLLYNAKSNSTLQSLKFNMNFFKAEMDMFFREMFMLTVFFGQL